VKTGFINAFANKPSKKQYSYHGLNRDCLIQPKPDPFLPVDTKPGEYLVLTFDYHDVTPNSATLEGVLIVAEGVKKFTKRGFLYGPTADYGYNFFEDGSFPAGNYTAHILKEWE